MRSLAVRWRQDGRFAQLRGSRGSRIAIAALTESSRPAAVQADVDLAIGSAARTVVEALRL